MMSLATRCPSCGTIFRVVQDQLKVCEGWVRCGRCDEVFSALEGLFDLERDPPPDWSPGSSLPTAAPEPMSDAPAGPMAQAEARAGAPDLPAAADPKSLPTAAEQSIGDSLDGRREPTMAALVPDPVRTIAEPVAPVDRAASDLLPAGAAEDEPAPPGFLRHAQRQARWQTPAVRATLGVGALGLLLLLAGQATHHFRDPIASRWPEAGALLSAWCGVAGCAIEAPKRIEDFSVESSTLNHAGAANTFKLAVTLRNRGRGALALPAIELSLTDATGQLVARRALMPRDFRVASPVLAAGAEAPLQLVLGAGSPRVTGYTVELFYP